MGLQQPLTEIQIDAAARLYELLESWKTTDSALNELADHFPGTDLESCLVKTVTINSLYSTQVWAVWRMAVHVQEILNREDTSTAGSELIESLAALRKVDGSGVERRFRSFASKFAHFFIDSDRFPILDSLAEKMIAYHLGRVRAKNDAYPYVAFHENFFTLKKAANIADRPNCDLDRYLWLAGQYRHWLTKPEAEIGREVRSLFETENSEIKRLLDQLFPNRVDRE